MNETAPMTANQVFTMSLQVATKIHSDILNDDAFAGYGGDIEAFNRLLSEVHYIASDSRMIHPDCLDFDNLHNTWYEVQTAIGNGEVEVDWFL